MLQTTEQNQTPRQQASRENLFAFFMEFSKNLQEDFNRKHGFEVSNLRVVSEAIDVTYRDYNIEECDILDLDENILNMLSTDEAKLTWQDKSYSNYAVYITTLRRVVKSRIKNAVEIDDGRFGSPERRPTCDPT